MDSLAIWYLGRELALIKRIELVREHGVLIVELREVMDLVSTVPIIGVEPRFIVFKTVDKDFNETKILDFYRRVLESIGIDSGVVLLTSVPVDDYVREPLLKPFESEIIATIGLEPAVCIDFDTVFKPLIGTINLAIITSAPLTNEAAIDLLRTVTEAKTLAAVDITLRCNSRSSGTVTDAIVIALPRTRRRTLLFAGMATDIGNAIAKAVYRLIMEKALSRLGTDGFLKNVLGIDRERMLELALKIYRRAPIPGLSDEEARALLAAILDDVLRDPNVWSFLVAARELDLHAYAGSIPGLSKEEFLNDSVKIVADELLGIALALYVAGAKGLFSMYWIEKLKKSGALEPELPMFEDDVLSALLGSLLTRLYDSYRGESR